MKNFRSSKLLKPVDAQTKQEGNLKIKVKQLQQQIQLLQKSNLNIFIPLSQHNNQPSINYEAIINKLKAQIMNLEKDNINHKTTIKKLQRQKQQLKINHLNQIKNLKLKIQNIQQQKKQLQKQIQSLQNQLQNRKIQYQILDRQMIQKNVQLKYLHQDFYQAKLKIKQLQNKIQNLQSTIGAVIYSSRIYKSKQKKIICLQKQQYDTLKDRIKQLQLRIRQLLESQQRQLITLGVRKSDVGQEIVRLKKNIDLQLGVQGKSKHSDEFLKIYKDTNNLFNQLISQCKT